MVIARSTSETFQYVIAAERDLPPEKQTIFHLRRLSASVGMALDNLTAANTNGELQVRIGDRKMVTLLAGLAGWSNLPGADGAPVEFRTVPHERVVYGIALKNSAHQTMVDLLPGDVIDELVTAILHGNTVTATEVKN